MITYLINIVTVAKKEDAYDNVSVNTYPIIIQTFDKGSLRSKLQSLKDKIKKTLKNKYLYDNACFYIRTLDGEEFKWKLKDVVDIRY